MIAKFVLLSFRGDSVDFFLQILENNEENLTKVLIKFQWKIDFFHQFCIVFSVLRSPPSDLQGEKMGPENGNYPYSIPCAMFCDIGKRFPVFPRKKEEENLKIYLNNKKIKNVSIPRRKLSDTATISCNGLNKKAGFYQENKNAGGGVMAG